VSQVPRLTRRIYRTLELDGYARIDYRLSPAGELFFLEANPNPEIAEREEFAQAAMHAGVPYPELLERILRLGIGRTAGASVAD
jgi:D-alanine-D-alanine ligase